MKTWKDLCTFINNAIYPHLYSKRNIYYSSWHNGEPVSSYTTDANRVEVYCPDAVMANNTRGLRYELYKDGSIIGYFDFRSDGHIYFNGGKLC